MNTILCNSVEMVLGILYNWKFWVILALLIILIVWIFSVIWSNKPVQQTSSSRSKNKSRSRKTKEKYNVDSDSDDSDNEEDEDDEEERVQKERPVKRHVMRVANYQHKNTSHIDTCEDIEYPKTGNEPNIDFTPEVPVYADHTGRKTEKWKREGECRRILEMIYGVPFPKSYPEWLFNDKTGKQLELDGFCEPLRLAFEHMGEQHYIPHHRFNKSVEDYYAMVYRDNRKVDLCQEKKVFLMIIPYHIKFDQLENFIRHHLPEVLAARQAREQQIQTGIQPSIRQVFAEHIPTIKVKPVDPELQKLFRR
jgi:hypothetical protein